jgi:hypothetical protein
MGVGAAERLVSGVLDAPTRAHGVAELNERLSDARSELEAGAGVPRLAARVALVSGTFLAMVEILRGLSQDRLAVRWAVAAFVSGLVSAMITAYLGRLADSRAAVRRDNWNALSRRLIQLLPPDPDAPSSSGRQKSRRRCP